MGVNITNNRRGRWSAILITIACSLASGVILSGQEQTPIPVDPVNDNPAANPEWLPPVDGFDWLQLTSNEWLKGEIIALYNDSMEFDSDKLNFLTIDFEDIKQIRTKRYHQVMSNRQDPVTGSLTMMDGTITVRGREEVEIDRDELVSIAAGDAKEINYWRAKVTLGMNLREGNASQLDYSTKWAIQRRTAKTRFVLDYLGAISRTDDIDTVNNHRVTSYVDYFFSRRFFIRPANFEYFKDTFQNIENRYTLSSQVGYTLIDTSRTEWDVSGGPGYQVTEFGTVEEGADTLRKTFTGSISTRFDTELTDWMDSITELQFVFGDEDSGGLTTHFISTLETELTRSLDLDISFIWDRVQNPVPESDGNIPQQDDFRMTVGLGIDL